LSVGEAGRRIARKLQVPFIFEVQDVWPDAVYGLGIIQNPILKKILDSFTRRIYQDASAIVALSPDMIPMINRLGDFAGKILVSPNGTDTDMFYPAREKSGERVEFVYAGAIGRANGLESLVRTIQILKKREIKGLHFTILGNGNRYKEVRKLAEGLEDWIEWIPEVSKQSVPEILRRATIGLVWFAPVKELESNSANKFFDYLASGLPIFLNYGGWQAEVLRDAECGMFVLGNEVEVLADGLIEMASDPVRLRDMGLNARELALREYDREALSRKVLACTKHSLHQAENKKAPDN
jgi:glycosyltransferase involved in cell wall biosynthesis